MMARRRLYSVDDVILNILDDVHRPREMDSSYIKNVRFYREVNDYLLPYSSAEIIKGHIVRVLEGEGYIYEEWNNGKRWKVRRPAKPKR